MQMQNAKCKMQNGAQCRLIGRILYLLFPHLGWITSWIEFFAVMPTNNADSDESTASGTEDEDETTTTGGRGTDISRQQSMEAAGNGAQGPHVTSVTLGEAIIIDLLAFSE